MDSRTVMNYLLIAVAIAGVNILGHVTLFHTVETPQLIWAGFLIIHLIAGLFLGYTGLKVGDETNLAGMTLLIPIVLILANMMLTITLVSSLKLFEGSAIRGFLGAVTAMGLGFGIPLILAVTGRKSSGQSLEDGPPPDVHITDVILEETGIRCPICYNFPEQEGHYLIRCYRCSAEFCSKHLEENEDRCWRCRTPIPFIKQLKLAVKENLSA